MYIICRAIDHSIGNYLHELICDTDEWTESDNMLFEKKHRKNVNRLAS